MTVRLAVPADEDAIWDLLLALNAENNSFDIEYDEERAREHIRLGTERRGGFHGVIDGHGGIVGSIGIVFDRYWCARNYHLQVLWLFVRPECRRGAGYADALIRWARAYRDELSKEHQIDLIDSPFSRVRLDAKLRWWRARGEQIGGIFVMK